MSIIYMVFFIYPVNCEAQLMFGIRKSPNEPKRTRVLALWHVAGCGARYNARPQAVASGTQPQILRNALKVQSDELWVT
jgi:hypothetical protein